MGITLSVLASGSRGNSTYVATERARLLVDGGLSAREIERRLLSVGASPKDLDGIVVTHEHVDHVRGVGTLSRRYELPVYLNKQTYKHLPDSMGRIDQKEEFVTGKSFCIEDVTIHPFAISHDGVDPVGFTLANGSVKIGVCTGSVKIGVCTDLGAATKLVYRHLEHCSVLILEANHDMEMLKNGPYPWPVKQRIKSRIGHLSNEQSKSRIGHLSNEQSVDVLSRVFSENLQEVVLAHMSETNNSKAMVSKTFSGLLDHHMRERLNITLASQHQPLDLIQL
jgi:phosphoribosyl 1,2-cyclic phosphodiesterase